MKKTRTAAAILLLSMILAVTACSVPARKSGSAYPTKAIEYVVPFSPGGGVDLAARATADYLSKEWKQPISVVNKPGGGGAVGSQAVLKQGTPDGYTVLAVNNSSTSLLTAGMAKPPLQIGDHSFVARTVEDAAAFAVKSDAPWKDFKEFSDWAKKNPDKLTYTSVGPAGFSAFGVAEWMNAIGADFSKARMVETKGASDSAPLIAGGHAVLAVHTVAELYPLAAGGKIKILAVVSDKRSPFFPNIPTAAEQGVKELMLKWWTGISFSKGTPEDVRKKWEDGIAKMAKDPAFTEKLKNMQMQSAFLNSSDFNSFISKETDYYSSLGTKLGIRK